MEGVAAAMDLISFGGAEEGDDKHGSHPPAPQQQEVGWEGGVDLLDLQGDVTAGDALPPPFEAPSQPCPDTFFETPLYAEGGGGEGGLGLDSVAILQQAEVQMGRPVSAEGEPPGDAGAGEDIDPFLALVVGNAASAAGKGSAGRGGDGGGARGVGGEGEGGRQGDAGAGGGGGGDQVEGGGDEEDEWEVKVGELEAMGFPRGNSQAALAVAEGNLTRAVEILTGAVCFTATPLSIP